MVSPRYPSFDPYPRKVATLQLLFGSSGQASSFVLPAQPHSTYQGSILWLCGLLHPYRNYFACRGYYLPLICSSCVACPLWPQSGTLVFDLSSCVVLVDSLPAVKTARLLVASEVLGESVRWRSKHVLERSERLLRRALSILYLRDLLPRQLESLPALDVRLGLPLSLLLYY